MIARSRLACLIGALATVWCFASANGHAELPDGWIFWAQSPHGGTDERGSIVRADLDTPGAIERVVVGAKAPGGIAVDDQYVYWANYTDGTIGRARLDGTGVNERFISTGQADAVIGVAIDTHHIYWTHRYWHLEKDGVYFTYAIAQADLDGTHIDRRYILTSNVLDGVAVNSRYILWSNDGEHVIGRANLDGSHVWQRCINSQTLPLETVPEGLAADEGHVYWTNYPADTIARARTSTARMSTAGSSPRMARPRASPRPLAAEQFRLGRPAAAVQARHRPFYSARPTSRLARTARAGERWRPQ